MSDPSPSTAPLPSPPRRSWRQRLRRLCLRLTIYWVLYTLSIGPMFWYWFEAHYIGGERWIAAFYYPLLFVCDHVKPYGDMVNWYINLWILK